MHINFHVKKILSICLKEKTNFKLMSYKHEQKSNSLPLKLKD